MHAYACVHPHVYGMCIACTQVIHSAQLRDELDLLLKLALQPEERDVLRLRYGLDDGNAKTAGAVGRIIGIKLTQVRGLEARALKALRRPTFLQRLETYLEYDL